MSIVRSLARPLLAAPFIYEGVQTFQQPERVLAGLPVSFADVDAQLAKTSVPADAETILKVAGGVAAVAGTALALNKVPRVAALALLATTSVGLAGRKRVWELEGTERLEELKAIAGDLGLLGGVLLAAVDTDGKPSLAYRVDKLIERGQKSAEKRQREIAKAGKKLGGSSKKSTTSFLDELDAALAKKIKAA